MAEDRRIRKTKACIKQSLIELLESKKISDITVTELTERADISRKTFYLHYNSIYDAKEDIDDDLISRLQKITESIPLNVQSSSIMNFFEEVHSLAMRHPELVSYFVINSRRSNLYTRVKMVLSEAINKRINTDGKNTLHNEYINEIVVSGILSAFIRWNHDKDITIEQLSEILTEFCTNATKLVIA